MLKRVLFSDGVSQREVIDRLDRTQTVTVISLPNYLDFVARSDAKNAVPFREWVFGEVLPTIFKTGSYSVHGANSQGLVELDPCEAKDNAKLLRRVVMFYEDVILGAQKKLDLYKGLEEHYHPEQARARGKRDVHPINVYRTDENTIHLAFGVFEEVIVQNTFVFEE